MAAGRCDNAVDDVIELEVMRKGSLSWHPCQVSLCSSGLGLIVVYGDNHPKEVIADKQEVLSRIRVRSTPLQGGDCSSLQQGNHILATKSSDVKGVFCDARVEKAIRVRHSKRTHCRCSFTIKWLHQPLEEEALTVPASSIMKLSAKSTDLHPTISTFFSMLESSMLESSNGGDSSLCSKIIVDSMNWEMDINLLLEKQIEEITNSTDVSHKKISKNIVFELEVDLKGQSQGRTISASLKEPRFTVPLLDCLKGSTWCENKQSVDATVETLPASVSPIQETFAGSRLPLNPLAARAALASLRSKFPQKTELSVHSNVEKGGVINEHFSSVSSALVERSSNFEGIAKTLLPTSGASLSDVFSGAQVKGTKKNKNISEKRTIRPSETRFTRSQIEKSYEIREFTPETDTTAGNDTNLFGKEEKRGTSDKDAEKYSCPRRITRSAAGDETKKNNVPAEPKIRKSKLPESAELGNASTDSKRLKTTTPKTAVKVLLAIGKSQGRHMLLPQRSRRHDHLLDSEF
ncbi:hypothetical protein OROGR_017543 [Orobanche gracilis]